MYGYTLCPGFFWAQITRLLLGRAGRNAGWLPVERVVRYIPANRVILMVNRPYVRYSRTYVRYNRTYVTVGSPEDRESM